MKKLYTSLTSLLMISLLFPAFLNAQETLVSVKVKEDGKVVKDTTYKFEDAEQAEHALMIMDMIGSDDDHIMKVHKDMSQAHAGHSKTMVFISEDGKTTEIKEMDGDSLVWISEGEDCDHKENVKIIKYKVDGDESHGKKVVVVKSGDGETFDILIDEEGEAKEVKVIVKSDDDGEWTVTEEEMDEDGNVEVIIIEEKEVKKKSKKQ